MRTYAQVAFYWGGMICANVSHVTVAGTVGSWWFTPQVCQSMRVRVHVCVRACARVCTCMRA